MILRRDKDLSLFPARERKMAVCRYKYNTYRKRKTAAEKAWLLSQSYSKERKK